MNFFILDTDPIRAAEQNCDKHICKIILEAADCMCLAHWETGGLPSSAPIELRHPYLRKTKRGDVLKHLHRAQTQVNNHVTVWVRTALDNYRWVAEHAKALCDQYEMRYHRTHATKRYIEWFAGNEPKLPTGSTPFRQAVARDPIDCVRNDVVLAYKLYYVYYKNHFAKWKNGNTPDWYTRMREVVKNGGAIQTVEQAA